MPPLTTTLMLLLAGACVMASAYFFMSYRVASRRSPERLAFSFVALFGAAFAISITQVMHAPDIESSRRALILYLGVFMPTFLSLLWFSSFYTGMKRPRFLWGMTFVTVAFLIGHFLSPYGLLARGIQEYATRHLPWGESVVWVRMDPSPWLFPWYAYLFVGLAYCAVGGWQNFIASGRREGRGFLVCIALAFVAGINNMMVDLGRHPGTYISEMCIVAFIVLMTVELAREWRNQEVFYNEVFDAQNDAVFIHDPADGNILRVNETAKRMYRASGDEMLGLVLERGSAVSEGYTMERAKAYMDRAAEKGPQVFQWRARRLDGTEFWSEVSLRSAMLGGRRRVIAVVRDITERLGQEAALRMGEERFSHVVKASPVGMQFFRLEEDGRLRLAGANPAADKLLGVDHSKLMGRSIEEAFPSTEGSGFVEHLCGTARSGTPLRMEMVDPREGMGQGAFEVIATRSEPGMVVVMYLDITERRKAEQERLRVEIRSQEAQRLESLGMMASGVAHDFNNVLQAIRGQVDVLESRYAAPETSETFGDLSSSIQHAADLCRQLLAYSGKGHVRLEELDLGKLVRETGKVAMFGSKKKVEWDFEVSEPSPRVRGDATQLRQVVLNLLVNAVEALPREGGKVRARLRVEDLPRPEEGLAPGPAARLEVSDNGCGMSEESLARLFEPFYTTKVTGRGLGLAAVQGILRAHQGVIRVVSRVGEGTTMTVWLPALAGKAEVMENPKTTMGAFQGRALLVDDEADVRRVTHRMLERLGIEVTAAGDGASGIAACQENKDSVVGALLDLTMPDMDGLEVYRRLLETRPDLPALLISGYGMEEMRERLKSFPRMVLLQKPFGQKELMVALESIGWPKAKAPKTP